MKKSIIEKKLSEKSRLRKKEFKKYKMKCIQKSFFVSAFFLFLLQLIIKNLFLSLGISFAIFAIVFVLFLQKPIIKAKKYSKKVESEMPNLIINLITSIKSGKDLISSIKDNIENNAIGKEMEIVLKDVKNGFSFQKALENFNKRVDSIDVKRLSSSLNNIYLYGGKEIALKKLSEELLLKQKIESKEFSGKMVVYSLVFIAVSAIVPAMFSSFVIVGSYFMELQFEGWQIFLIIILVFPVIDLAVLGMINSKTPLFLRG
jgi:pilus assembly protein TadC